MRRTLMVATRTVPVVVSTALLVAACGSGGSQSVAQQPPAGAAPAAAPAQATTTDAAPVAPAGGPAAAGTASESKVPAAPAAKIAKAEVAKPAESAKKAKVVDSKQAAAPAAGTKVAALDATDEQRAANQKIYDDKQGATDVGISKDAIHLGSISMHGIALGNVIVEPVVRGNFAAISAQNDRGGVLGRRLSITDCDDGPGEVSRAKACIKKLVNQDHIFTMVTAIDWATASLHDDLKQYQLPYVGAWAYSQTEWQDPYMFPTHMSMIHEAMAGAHWAANVVKPKTYGMICLTSPEMQLACAQVQRIMDASGSKLVKKTDLSISETSMSAEVLAMRAANPEHIIHYVINPATMSKFMIEAAQQGYYPPKGISGNHLALEVLGSIFGKWPTGRYWTNTTYKMWGPEFMATMSKYARGNRGTNHHIVQAGYVAINIFAEAARSVGPNLTRQRLIAALGNGTVWAADASLDQRFSYSASERGPDNWSHDMGQGREFMYRYDSTNTVSAPDGTPTGYSPDPGQFVIYTWK